MRKCIGGDGSDTTAAVVSYLAAHRALYVADLTMIGELEDPATLFLTTFEAPLTWPLYPTFKPKVYTRGGVSSKIGLDVASLDFNWSPPVGDFTQNVATTSPYQLAQLGRYDNKSVRIWRTFMPTKGDANTLGACEWFGGWVSKSSVVRGKIVFSVDSFLSALSEKIPQNVIELNSTLAAFRAAVPPPGLNVVPFFTVQAGSTTTLLILDCTTPTAHQIFNDTTFLLGYVAFQGGSLDKEWRTISSSSKIKIPPVTGIYYNTITLYAPLPWAPTPGDVVYVSAAAPATPDQGAPDCFLYVPDSAQAI